MKQKTKTKYLVIAVVILVALSLVKNLQKQEAGSSEKHPTKKTDSQKTLILPPMNRVAIKAKSREEYKTLLRLFEYGKFQLDDTYSPIQWETHGSKTCFLLEWEGSNILNIRKIVGIKNVGECRDIPYCKIISLEKYLEIAKISQLHLREMTQKNDIKLFSKE